MTPHMLIMDQKVTTQPVLAELDQRGIKFLTLRMRSPALVSQINTLAPADYKTITLDRPGRHNRPQVHESTAHADQLPRHPAPVHHHRTGPRRPHRRSSPTTPTHAPSN